MLRLWLDFNAVGPFVVASSRRSWLQQTVLPALGRSGQWLAAAFTTREFSAAFSGVLLRRSFSSEDLENVGAHSLKTTALCWCAKFGLDKDVRRMLGYHVLLDKVLAAIRTGQFKPDVTRSGVFASEGVLELPHGCPEQPPAPHRQCWHCGDSVEPSNVPFLEVIFDSWGGGAQRCTPTSISLKEAHRPKRCTEVHA